MCKWGFGTPGGVEGMGAAGVQVGVAVRGLGKYVGAV